MTLTKEQIEELEQLAKPVVRWIRQNCHPHCEVIIGPLSLTVNEGIADVPYVEFEPETLQ